MNLFDYDKQLQKEQKQKMLQELFEAYYAARKNKRNKLSQISFEFDCESKIIALRDAIVAREYEPLPSIAFVNHKPAMREVFAAAFQDRIVHHFIFRHINHIFEKEFIEDSYSCRKGKGTLYGIERVASFIKSCSKDYTQECYILKLDLKGYFYNIDKKLLYKMIREVLYKHKVLLKIDLDTILYLIEKTIFTDVLKNIQKIGTPQEWAALPKSKSLFFAKEGKGLPIGNLTSQLFSNIYMNGFDHFIKDELKIEYYGRYVDDFVIVHRDKEFLKSVMKSSKVWLDTNLGMTLHPKKIYLQPYQRGVQFLGGYIKPQVNYISKRTKTNFYALIKKINREFMQNVDNMSYYKEIRAKINSYLGTMRHFSSFKLRKKILSTLIDSFWVCFGVDKEYKKVVLDCKYGFENEKLLLSSTYL
jgi:hypothetical protein